MKIMNNQKNVLLILFSAFLFPFFTTSGQEEINFADFNRTFSERIHKIFNTDYQVEVESKKLTKIFEQLFKEKSSSKLKINKILFTCENYQNSVNIDFDTSRMTKNEVPEITEKLKQLKEYADIVQFLEFKFSDYEHLLNLLIVDDVNKVDLILNSKGNIEFEINDVNDPWRDNYVVSRIHVETSYKKMTFLTVSINFINGKFFRLKMDFVPVKKPGGSETLYLISDIYTRHNLPQKIADKIAVPPKNRISLRNYKFLDLPTKNLTQK